MTMKRILIVDDNEFIRTLISGVLKEAGFETDSCVDGAEAIAKLETHEYDLLITDIVMPNESGVKVASHVKKKGLKIPVVIVSAHVDSNEGTTLINFARQYAHAMLPKPFQKDELLRIIEGLS